MCWWTLLDLLHFTVTELAFCPVLSFNPAPWPPVCLLVHSYYCVRLFVISFLWALATLRVLPHFTVNNTLQLICSLPMYRLKRWHYKCTWLGKWFRSRSEMETWHKAVQDCMHQDETPLASSSSRSTSLSPSATLRSTLGIVLSSHRITCNHTVVFNVDLVVTVGQ